MSIKGKQAWVVPALAACLLIISSGVGFAAFTSTATVHGTATRASFGLVITNVSRAAGEPWIVIHTTHLPATIVTVWINGTTQSSLTNVSVTVENIGTVPAQNIAYGFSTSLHGPSSCSIGTYMYPSAPNVPDGAVLAPGASFPSYWEFQAGPHLSACAGAAFFSFTIAYTATAGS
jgi:hypothetical protein